MRKFLFAALCAGAATLWMASAMQSASAQQSAGAQQAPATVASTVDRDISAVEKQIIDAAEAMPEDKFNFTPETLNILGSEYKGVRSFAVQVKHIAASNWFIWSALTGDKLPEGLNDGNGPANLRSKPEIIKFLKDSFALGHRAAATLTSENMLQTLRNGQTTRLSGPRLGWRTLTIITDRWWSICG